MSGVLPPPPVDLVTLLGEMTALKTEVRAETRAARDVRDGLVESQAALREELARASAREERSRAAADGERTQEQRRAARALLAVLDRIEALGRAARAARPRGIWPWRRVDPAVRSLAEGLALTEARVAESLGGMGMTRIVTASQPLDPRRMEAIGTTHVPGAPDLVVAEELVSGWMHGAEVFRAAQVVVNRVPMGQSKKEGSP